MEDQNDKNQQQAGAASAVPEKTEVAYELEYETQFLEFAPKGFVDSIYNIMFETMKEKLDDLKNSISEQCPGVMSAEDLDVATDAVKSAMVEWMNAKFQSVEYYSMNKIFAIPPYLCLPEDEIHHDERLATINRGELEREVRDLEKQLATMKFMKDQIQEEKQLIQQVREVQATSKDQMQKVMEYCAKLDPQIEADEEEVMLLIEEMQRNQSQ